MFNTSYQAAPSEAAHASTGSLLGQSAAAGEEQSEGQSGASGDLPKPLKRPGPSGTGAAESAAVAGVLPSALAQRELMLVERV